MNTFPYHHLTRAYTADTPKWSIRDSGISSMRLENGVLRTRRVLGSPVRAIQVAIEAMTTDDVELLWQFIADHEIELFLWYDPKRGPTNTQLYAAYECRFDPDLLPEIIPNGSVPDRWDASITLLPLMPCEPAETLVAWWPMDEGGVLLVGTDEALTVGSDEVLAFAGGSDVSDATGNGHGGTASQSMDVMVAAGKLTSALTFNGSSDYVAVADDEDLRLTEGGSILAWINPTGLGESDGGRIVDKSNTVSAGAGHYFALAAGNKLAFRVSGDLAETLSSANAITIGSWQHVAVVFDAYGRKLYVNGVDVTASGGSATRLPAASTAELRLGNRAGATDRSFYGLLDDVRIYNRPLSSQELAAIYNSGSGTAEEVVP